MNTCRHVITRESRIFKKGEIKKPLLCKHETGVVKSFFLSVKNLKSSKQRQRV